jgi:hypothetical protein
MIVMKSGTLFFLEPSGPVQACTGIALSFKKDTGARFDTAEDVIVARIAGIRSCNCDLVTGTVVPSQLSETY